MLAFFKILSMKTFETRFAIKAKKSRWNEIWGSWKLWSTNIRTSCFLFHHCLSFCVDVKENNNKIVLRDCLSRETNMLCGHTITTILRHEGLESQYGKIRKGSTNRLEGDCTKKCHYCTKSVPFHWALSRAVKLKRSFMKPTNENVE